MSREAQQLVPVQHVSPINAIRPAKRRPQPCWSERLVFEAGQDLFREGDVPDAAYLVIEGTVEISIRTRHGPRVLNTLGRSDMVGESAIFGALPHTATATAATRVEVLRVGRDVLTARAAPGRICA
jgi:CRP-like cAMP-binding protein